MLYIFKALLQNQHGIACRDLYKLAMGRLNCIEGDFYILCAIGLRISETTSPKIYLN